MDSLQFKGKELVVFIDNMVGFAPPDSRIPMKNFTRFTFCLVFWKFMVKLNYNNLYKP
jgi:hypothetical protein